MASGHLPARVPNQCPIAHSLQHRIGKCHVKCPAASSAECCLHTTWHRHLTRTRNPRQAWHPQHISPACVPPDRQRAQGLMPGGRVSFTPYPPSQALPASYGVPTTPDADALTTATPSPGPAPSLHALLAQPTHALSSLCLLLIRTLEWAGHGPRGHRGRHDLAWQAHALPRQSSLHAPHPHAPPPLVHLHAPSHVTLKCAGSCCWAITAARFSSSRGVTGPALPPPTCPAAEKAGVEEVGCGRAT